MKRVKFYDDQQLSAADLDNIQVYQDEYDQKLLMDAITPEKLYTGLKVATRSSHELEIGNGRIWDGSTGMAYNLYDPVVMNLLSDLPVTDQRYLCLMIRGEEENSDIVETDFVVKLDPVTFQPKPVARQTLRRVAVSRKMGIESPDPEKPLPDTGYSLLGYVLLDTSGIVAVEQNENLKMVSAQAIHLLTRQNDAKINALTQSVAQLDVDLAAARMQVNNSIQWKDLESVIGDVAELKQNLALPDTGSNYGLDNFLSKDETDETDANIHCEVDYGVRFPWEGLIQENLELDDSADSLVSQHNGLIMPAYDLVTTLDVNKDAGLLNIGQYESVSRIIRQGVRTVTTYEAGPIITYCTNGANAGARGNNFVETRRYGHHGRHYWVQGYNMVARTQTEHYTYEDDVVTTHNIQGYQIAQTWTQTQERWRKAVGVQFGSKPGHDVHMFICETRPNGDPDFDRCIAKTTVAEADICTGGPTWFDFDPFFLGVGTYAAVIVTQGAYNIMQARDEDGVLHGSLLVSTDAVKWAVTLDKDLKIKFKDLKFQQNNVSVLLRPISLSGGMAMLRFDFDGTIPQGTSVIPEFRRDGDAQWYPLESGTTDKFNNLPALMHLRLRFVGSSKLAAGIYFPGSKVRAGRAGTAFTHPSVNYTLDQARENITCVARCEHFDTAEHDITCRLVAGDVTHDADQTSTKVLGPDQNNQKEIIERRWTFAIPDPGTDKAKFVLTGTAANPLNLFHVAERSHFAL